MLSVSWLQKQGNNTMNENGTGKQYACPACGSATTRVVNTASMRSCIVRTRRCLFCGYMHDTCEAKMDVSELMRDAMKFVVEGNALMQEMRARQTPCR